MLTSIATVSLSGTLEAKLRASAQARFHGVEIFENDLLTARGSAREVAAQMRDLGLACTLFQPFRDFEGMPDELRTRTFDRLETKFDLMQELGAPLLLVCSNVSPASSGDRGRIVADFRELAERAAKRNLRVGYEALAWGRHVFGVSVHDIPGALRPPTLRSVWRRNPDTGTTSSVDRRGQPPGFAPESARYATLSAWYEEIQRRLPMMSPVVAPLKAGLGPPWAITV